MAAIIKIGSLMLSICGLLILTGIPSTNAEVLDPAACLAIKSMFIANNCISDQSRLLCRFLGFPLTENYQNDRLCNDFPCVGYHQAPNFQCRMVFFQPCQNVDFRGICAPGKVCCRVRRNEVEDQSITLDGSD